MSLLLQITDDGNITDSDGRRVNFRNTYIIMTSNAGFGTSATSGGAGFISHFDEDFRLSGFFTTELLGRIDEIIHFNSLSDNILEKIADKHLKEFTERLRKNCGVRLDYDREVCRYILKSKLVKKRGARTINHTITSLIENPIAELLISQKIKSGDSLRVFLHDENIKIECVKNETKTTFKIK